MAAFSSDELRCIEQQIECGTVVPTSIKKLNDVYELNQCEEWIRANKLSKVCLQFPDSFLCDAPDVALSLEKLSGAQCFVSGDTSYGSCCVDEVSAEHVNADGIIHFGHACLSPVRRLPVLYIFQKKTIDVETLSTAFKTSFKDPDSKVLLFYDVAYAYKIEEIHHTLSQHHPCIVSANPIVNRCDTLEASQTCLGSSFQLIENTSVEDYNVLYIGKDGRTFSNLVLELAANSVFQFDPEENLATIHPANTKISKFLMKRLHLVERVKDAKTLGILIGTLGVNGYLEAVDRIKALAKNAGKKTYIFAVGKPNIPKLANFPEVDIFVLVACPENTLLDWKDFYQPVVSLYEVELACNPARQWSPKYVTDFTQLLSGGTDHVQLSGGSTEDVLDVSLVTGKVRNFNIGSTVTDSVDKSIASRGDLSVCIKTGSQFLANRSWQGLEQNLGETPVELAAQGRSGIASGYQSERLHEV